MRMFAKTTLAPWRIERQLAALKNRWRIAEEEQRVRSKEIAKLENLLAKRRKEEQW